MTAPEHTRLPFRLRAIGVTRVWGGTRILDEFHPDLSTPLPVGESWEVSDIGNDPAHHSVVAGGSAAGRTLRSVIEESPADILGDGVLSAQKGSRRLPLLYKYIDAHSDLSVQVHPSDSLVRELKLPDRGKSEAWIILDALPGSHVICGLQDGISYRDYLQGARAGRGAEGLRRIPVQRGDVFYLPAGILHGIGGGVFLAEIQQSSDHTFRIYDWDRKGLDGKPRSLQLEEAGLVDPPDPLPRFPLSEPHRRGPFTPRIENAPFSVLELRTGSGEFDLPPMNDRFAIFSLLEGNIDLTFSNGVSMRIDRGGVFFFPAASESAFVSCETAVWGLWMCPGDELGGDH